MSLESVELLVGPLEGGSLHRRPDLPNAFVPASAYNEGWRRLPSLTDASLLPVGAGAGPHRHLLTPSTPACSVPRVDPVLSPSPGWPAAPNYLPVPAGLSLARDGCPWL
jgi:hypothetical protein